ncbi:LytR/AlgR family response regulator transcription factor [Mediterraneibacter agrestimuris]|uniref:LytR/AlgR family response regulator transcription factor n=1 Tax=Mediterraneibacter agrestimuris TaxID=2941333 RepID=UPI00203E1B79|nr:LytTR family DNA-binding domain-containing protein [Mediterraneibacter agrestimuris]
MRILICDDNSICSEQIKQYLLDYFNRNHLKIPEIACFQDGKSLMNDTGEQDILFLDIEMPGMNGIYIGNELKERNKKIIIFVVTSYIEYLDEAMRFHVFRYLTKPIDKQRFYRNLKDALKIYSSSNVKVLIETKTGAHTILESDIICIEAVGKSVTIHTIDTDIETKHPIYYWLNVLKSNCFFQSHRSFIINFKYVTEFNHTLIYLLNDQQAYLTRRKYTSFKDAYFLYLESTR